MPSHAVDHRILGNDIQLSGLLGKLIGAGKRALGGESLFFTHFHADASPLPALRSVAVAAASRPTQDVPWVTS